MKTKTRELLSKESACDTGLKGVICYPYASQSLRYWADGWSNLGSRIPQDLFSPAYLWPMASSIRTSPEQCEHSYINDTQKNTQELPHPLPYLLRTLHTTRRINMLEYMHLHTSHCSFGPLPVSFIRRLRLPQKALVSGSCIKNHPSNTTPFAPLYGLM